ncbi:MAG: hypothetical protein II001_03570 [Bacteroidales bacterium]|nr:hypothetical protein [Bacteroidales bacterium]
MATYDLAYPGAAIDAILNTSYFLQEAGYIFQGSASEYSGTPSKRVWLIAPAGFTGYGISSPVPQGSIGICLYNGTSWVGKIINVATIDSTPTQNSGNAVSSGGAYAAINQLSASVTEALENLTFTDNTPSAFQDEYINMKVSTTEGGVERILTYFTILAATTSKAGLLSAADKVKIDSFLTNLRSLTFADTTASADQGTKITETLKATIGGVQEVIDSITLLAATSSKAGLLSASDKAYIDALPATLTSLSNSISGALALMQSLVGYYICDTAAGTAAKTVAATGYSLTNGGCIRIKMTNANTAANVTLNINSTGAKALYYDGAQASSTNTWEAGEVLEVYYDGTQYQCASGGGGRFATGEKVKETNITNQVSANSNDLPTSGAVYDQLHLLEQYPFELGTIDGSNGQDVTKTNGTRMRSATFVPKSSNIIAFHLDRSVSQINVILYNNGVYAGWVDSALTNKSAGNYTYTVNVNYVWDSFRLVCFTTGATAANVVNNYATGYYSVWDIIDQIDAEIEAVNEDVAALGNDLDDVKDVLPQGGGGSVPLELTQSDYSWGNIDSRNGNIITTDLVIYTTNMIDVSAASSLSYTLHNSYRLGVAVYNSAGTFVSKAEWFTDTGTYDLTGVDKIRIVIAMPSGTSSFDYSQANPSFSLSMSTYVPVASVSYVDAKFNEIYEDSTCVFELGTIDGSNGQLVTKTDGTRMRSVDYIPKNDGVVDMYIDRACSQINIIMYKEGVYVGWIDSALRNTQAGNLTYTINSALDFDTYKVVCFTSGATASTAANCYVKIKSLASVVFADDGRIDIEGLDTEKIYAYYDALLAKYPNYISKRILGMDSTGTHEIREYVATLRDNFAYLYKERCYAWKNNDTVIYSESVSPRIGDATYSDQLTTSTGYTVSASDCNNQTITVNGTVYNRYDTEDLNAMVEFRNTGSSATISVGGKVYNRMPNYDKSSTCKKTIVSICNEHGPGANGDPREPSVVMYYLLEALCGYTTNDPELDWLKKYAKIVIIPVSNPYAYDEEGSASQLGNLMGRVNANGVNINRNYPTANWTSTANNEGGAYGGSEVETQYNINCIMRHNADIAIDEHCLGPNTSNYNQWHYAGAFHNSVPSEIKMMILSTYNLAYSSYGAGEGGHFDTWITGQGIDGCLIEMNQGYGETLHADIILRADRAIWMGVLEYYDIFSL